MLLSVFLPFFNFFLIFSFGRYFGKIGTIFITLYSVLIITILNIKVFYIVLSNNISYFINIGSWINIELFSINWEFTLDPLAVSILAIVSFISIIVHIYSFSYIKIDPHFNRFISYLSLFTFFIFILVTAGNFIQLFLGWEGVGICSYLLINFWFTRVQANKAAIKALIMNRIGDIGFLLAVSIIFSVFKTLDFTTLQVLVPIIGEFSPIILESLSFPILYIDVICFFLLIGVAGKSAQLGLHTWLPAAIEGPTPVSALIHAATIVTAGVFLLIRVSFFFELSSNIRSLVIILGAITAFFSALTALFLYDIKKIIAYSTCSQLGYIVLAAGLSQYTISLFHLINHAFFKALLFLTAGAIIHTFNNEQDIRKLSGIFYHIPFIYSAILIGNIAIIGIPFLSGFYSKDLIIEVSYLSGADVFNTTLITINLVFIIILFATIFTGLYSLRLYYYLFLRQGIFHKTRLQNLGFKQPFFIQLSLSLLIIGSIFSGYLLSDLFSTTNNFFYHNNVTKQTNILHSISTYYFFENEFLPLYIKIAPLVCNIFVLITGLIFIIHYIRGKVPQYTQIILASISHFYRKLITFKFMNLYLKICGNFRVSFFLKIIQNNFYFNEFYNYISIVNYHYYYQGLFLNIDKGVLELIGPTGLSRFYLFITRQFIYFYKQGLTKHLFVIYNTILIYLYLFEFLF